jgi:starch-binding outer membrane protein, SusD/RagB family
MRSYDSRGVARRASTRRGALALLGLMLAATTACNSLLTVDNPGRVPEESLNDPALMPILGAAAIQQFQCGVNAFAATGAMLSGELLSSNGFVNNHPWEWRGAVEIRNEPGSCNTGRASTFMGFYTPLQQARYQLDDTFSRLEQFTDAQVPNRTRLMLDMRAYGGYAYLLLGEGMCEMAIDNGPAMTKAEVWAIAEQRFSDAITLAGTSTDTAIVSLKNMALVGRARARLDLGNLAGAAADAALVPQTFGSRNATFSEGTPARENRFYNLTFRNDYLSVGENYRGLTVGGQADPRVRATNLNRLGNDNATPMWRQEKYAGANATAPQRIASWNEAQLILAEAVGGQAGIDALNRVRAANGVTTALVYAGGDITDIVLEERRRQLFLEGQRYVDMLRKNLPFPTGVNGQNRKGQIYGPVTCVPLPNVETRNNPNFKT